MNVKLIGKHEKDSRACRDGLALTLDEMMAQDKSICYVDCDLMGCVNTKQLMAAYPDRAYEAGIVAGTTSTTFSPAKECTRAEMVCFLVRLLSDGATDNMPFVDVPVSAWYYNEVQWAWANGLTVGTSATTFSPDKVCNRAEAVEFLYNAFAE